MPSYYYKYIYKYTKSTPIDEDPRIVRQHDHDSTRRRKRHSSSSSRGEDFVSRSNDVLRPLWVTINKIDHHYGVSHVGSSLKSCCKFVEDIMLIDDTISV